MVRHEITCCHACKAYRTCRRYRGYWVCLGRCWRNRKVLVEAWNDQKRKEAVA